MSLDECYVLSDRIVCVRLITRPEESYRVWCVCVWWWNPPKMRRPWSPGGGGGVLSRNGRKNGTNGSIYVSNLLAAWGNIGTNLHKGNSAVHLATVVFLGRPVKKRKVFWQKQRWNISPGENCLPARRDGWRIAKLILASVHFSVKLV